MQRLTEDERQFWLTERQALLIRLGNIERRLGLARTRPPKHAQEKPEPQKKSQQETTG